MGWATYMGVGTASPTFGPGSPSCGNSGPGGSAMAFDDNEDVCYPLFGLGVTIDPTSASFKGACNVFNFNVSMNGDAGPAINPMQLPGSVQV